MDAIATPFVQGRLMGRPLKGIVTSECGYCRSPIELAIDEQLRIEVLIAAVSPLVSAPIVNFAKLRDPSIIDAF